MSIKKYTCPPQKASGENTFSDNLTGLQLVDGGGFTQGNFNFTTGITEKKNRTFSIGAFSEPINLDSMNINDINRNKEIVAKNFQVYPNYDLSDVTNFTLYGSLTKRIVVSIEKIINYFPAALDVRSISKNFEQGYTAINIDYDSVEDETYLEIPLEFIRNPFGIDFTNNSTVNFQTKEIEVSPLRNLSSKFSQYSLFVDGNEYPLNTLTPISNTDTVLKIYVKGKPFNDTLSESNLSIRPNDMVINEVFNMDFDQVENFLLNRMVTPMFTATFKVPKEADDGTYYIDSESLTFPRSGEWNLDITTYSI
jgi:hypothetical protein